MQTAKCCYKKCVRKNELMAPFDVERVQRGLETFHQDCLRKQRQVEQEMAQAQMMSCHIGRTIPQIVQ